MLIARKRSHQGSVCFGLSVAFLLLAGVASATPSITLSRKSGPPTIKVLVSGSGFNPKVEVDIYFDSKNLTRAMTDGEGGFQNARIDVPRWAHPREHVIKAVEDKGNAQQLFLVQTDWGQFHRLNMARYNPFENVLNPRNVGNLTLKWSFATGGFFNSASPVAADGVVYFGAGDGNVYALDAHTGARLWTYTTGGGIGATPAVADGVVYVDSSDGNVYALDAHTGTKLWSVLFTDFASSADLAVEDGVVYVFTLAILYALDAKTGAELWSYSTEVVYAGGAPAVRNRIVYNGVSREMLALDAESGTLLWSFTNAGYPFFNAAVADGAVYVESGPIVGFGEQYIYGLDARNGSQLWSYDLGGFGPDYAEPAVAKGVVYAQSRPGLYALDAKTGKEFWSYSENYNGGTAPAVANGVVYFASDVAGFALDAKTGSWLWSYVTGKQINASPIVVDGMLYIASQDQHLYAFGLPDDKRGEVAPLKRMAHRSEASSHLREEN